MKYEVRFRLSIYVLAILLSGCANQRTMLVTDTFDYPASINLSDVPFYPQQPLHCGPAALATVLQYYQQDVTPEGLAPYLFTPGAQGTFALDMVASVRRECTLPLPAPQDLSALLALTAQGWPSIHLMNLGFGLLPKWHYAVLVGYDLDTGAVLMRSGSDKERWYSFYHFQRARALADFWSIVPAPITAMPRLQDWTGVYRTLVDFEQVQAQNAAQAWQTAITVYPEYWQFHFALGNALFKQDPSGAAAAFLGGLVLSPQQAPVWNNLGFALESQGCYEKAREAVSCAIALDPKTTQWQQSLSELSTAVSQQPCVVSLICPVSD